MRRLCATFAALIVLSLGCGGADRAEDAESVQLMEAPPQPSPAPPVADHRIVPSAEGRGAGGAVGNVAGAFSGKQAASPQSLGTPGQQPGTIAPSMIIRTGHATVEVDSLEPAVANVQALALRVGGYVANISMHTGRAQLRQATLELKVPAARFDEALDGLEPLGEMEALEVSAQDVGEEYADLEARVSNARRLEERLLSLLATRTGRLEDVLAAERELARVREEIERYEGRLRYLQARTILSTLHVTVHEPAPILGRNTRNPIIDAFRGAWRNFVGFVAGLIELTGVLIPLAIIVVGIALAWRKWGPTFGKKRSGDSPA